MKKIIGIVLTLLTVGILCAAKKWDPKLVDEFKNAEFCCVLRRFLFNRFKSNNKLYPNKF